MARQINVQAAAQKLGSRIGASGASWTSGISNPRRDPNADAAGMTANWQAGVANAAPRYQAQVSAAGFVQKWQAGAQAKVSSYTGSGQRASAAWSTGFAPYAPQITQIASTLKKGPKGTNSANATAFGTALHQFKMQQQGK